MIAATKLTGWPIHSGPRVWGPRTAIAGHASGTSASRCMPVNIFIGCALVLSALTTVVNSLLKSQMRSCLNIVGRIAHARLMAAVLSTACR